MVLLGGLELIAGAYLINEHKKHKKEKARMQEERANRRTHKSRPSCRSSHSPPRRKHRHEDRKHRSDSPTRHDFPAKPGPTTKKPQPGVAKPPSQAMPTAAFVPASYYHLPQPKAHHQPQSSPMTYHAPPQMAHSPHQRPRPSPSPISPMEPEYLSNAPFDIPDGFSPEQRQQQASYATNYAPIHYPDNLAELGDPSVMGDANAPFQYDDGLIYDERRNRHVRFAIPRDGDETQLEVVHPRDIPPPPYTP
jgi:hypothetical protein